MTHETVIQSIARKVDAYHRCVDSENEEWTYKHESDIRTLIFEHMPSGLGFDAGTEIDLDASKADRIVLVTAYHHMDEGGMYDGWTEHQVIVTPSLVHGFNLRITGRNRNQIRDYIAETFDHVLGQQLGQCDEPYCDVRHMVREFVAHKATFRDLKASL